MKRYYLFLILIVFIINVCIFGSSFKLPLTNVQKNNVSQIYDSYKFAVQYGKTLSLNKKKKSNKKCLDIQSVNIMTIHGLWPYKKNKKIMLNNIDENYIKFNENLIEKLDKYWISFHGKNELLWSHEYNKHGIFYTKKICAKNHYSYFNKALEIYKILKIEFLIEFLIKNFIKENSSIKNLYYLEFDKNKLKELLEMYFKDNSFYLKCRKFENKQYFKEIIFKFDLDFKPLKNSSNVEDCNKAEKIRIPLK